GVQTGSVNMNGVIAGDGGGAGRSAGFHERSKPDVDGKNVCSARRPGEIAAGSLKNELNLFVERLGLEAWRVDWRVGRARDGVAMPGDHKEYAAIAGARNHECSVALEKRTIEDEVNALASDHQWLDSGIGHAANLVGEDAGCIDDYF